MKTTHLLITTLAALLSVGALSLTGCSGDDDDNNAQPGTDGGPIGTDGGPVGTDGGPVTDSGPPGPPALGAQIDRFGRPAVNTALNHTFDTDATAKGAAKDAYNADKGVPSWGKTYAPEIAANLAILDSLSTASVAGDGCGSQLGYGGGAGGYSTLSGALADDRMYLNTAGTTCTGFLGVEANALGILPNTDCGGRRPNDDVIDAEYSLLATSLPSGVTDGVAAPSSPAGTEFPYLSDPH